MKKVQEQDKEDEPPLHLVSSMRQKLRVGGLQGSATRYVMHLIECSAAMFEPIKPHGIWGNMNIHLDLYWYNKKKNLYGCVFAERKRERVTNGNLLKLIIYNFRIWVGKMGIESIFGLGEHVIFIWNWFFLNWTFLRFHFFFFFSSGIWTTFFRVSEKWFDYCASLDWD